MKKIYLLALTMTLLVVNIAFAADEIHWTVTGKDSVTFDWRGTSAENSIGYGLSSGNYTEVIATAPDPVPVSSTGPFWEAKLTGLAANTRYYYKIGNAPERSFHTPPIPGSSDFTVYAQGNIGSSSTYFNTGEVQDIIVNDMPSFVVGLGDLTLGSENGIATIDQHFNDVMLWSKEAAYMPVWGDKDTITSTNEDFKNYKGRFAVPNPQTSPGSPLAGGEDWYWFDYGNVRFITLPEPWTGAWADWITKAGTLMAQAQTDSDIKFIVTFVHRPAYSSGHYTGSSTLKSSLDKLGDTYSKYKLNINAHSNNYERSFPQHGVIHVTAGTGGANLTQDGACLWLTCTKPSWSAFRAMHLGVLKLHFTASGIEGSFICGPAGGGINDVNCTKGSAVDSFVIGTPPIKISAFSATTTSSYHAPAPISSLVVNVKDKGAVGNDSTNDTAAIQAAVNQVGGTGGTVFVPAGTYMIDALTSVKLKSNMTFKMDSGAVLKAIPNASSTYAILKIISATNVNVVGGMLQGERHQHLAAGNFVSNNLQWGMGIWIAASSNVYIEGVTATQCWGDGFYQGGSPSQSSNINFYSVVADDNRRQGLSIENVNGLVVRDSVFKNTNGQWPMAGIDIEPYAAGQVVTNVKILNNNINHNYRGITHDGSGTNITNILIDGNTITDNTWAGISKTRYATNEVITNNTITGSRNTVLSGS
ncbi:MAG: right-handed parallel beta-helix repeat-containing protein [Methylococcales bacterium]|nr:right-handed parallel beta-helix repeat-containing protein [Methylococcales bacterium]